MGYWVFMLLTSLPIPLIMIGGGYYYLKRGGPKKINMLFGYRTFMSMKNEDTWKFAHTYAGKTWWVTGWILLPLSILAMLFLWGKERETVGIFSTILCLVQLVPLIATVIPTEIALRKNFDENGNRKTER